MQDPYQSLRASIIKKSPTYGRRQISRPMWIEAPISKDNFFWRGKINKILTKYALHDFWRNTAMSVCVSNFPVSLTHLVEICIPNIGLLWHNQGTLASCRTGCFCRWPGPPTGWWSPGWRLLEASGRDCLCEWEMISQSGATRKGTYPGLVLCLFASSSTWLQLQLQFSPGSPFSGVLAGAEPAGGRF